MMRLRKITFKGVDTRATESAATFQEREAWLNWLIETYQPTSWKQNTWGLAWRDIVFGYWDHGPAVLDRCTDHENPEFHYPARFNDRVPKMVRMRRTAKNDLINIFSTGKELIAPKDHVFPAWTNSYGAVSAILPNGEKLGLYPNEFEVIEWLRPREIEKTARRF